MTTTTTWRRFPNKKREKKRKIRVFRIFSSRNTEGEGEWVEALNFAFQSAAARWNLVLLTEMGFCSSKSRLPWAELGAPIQRSNPQLPISRNNGLFSSFFFVGGQKWSVLKESRISSRPCKKPDLSEGCFKKFPPFFSLLIIRGNEFLSSLMFIWMAGEGGGRGWPLQVWHFC